MAQALTVRNWEKATIFNFSTEIASYLVKQKESESTGIHSVYITQMNAHSRSLQSALLTQKLLYLLSSEEKDLMANKVTTSQIKSIHFDNLVSVDMVNQTVSTIK